ncbi:MAG: Calx-beta domain-containing protein [Planctomycetia bacterium]
MLQSTSTTKAASYEAVIAVAALSSSGGLASFSNYGATTDQARQAILGSARPTATAGRNADYTATSGTLTFNPGETAKTIAVAVRNDTTVEANETFFLNLSSASGATISAGQGTGTIVNDDGIAIQIQQAAFATFSTSQSSTGTGTKATRR